MEDAVVSKVNSKLPAVNVPFEILAAIFELACHIDKSTLPRRSLPGTGIIHPYDTRHAIVLTCARWRQIAIQVPSLWNHIILAEPSRRIGYAGSNFIPIAIERSAGRSLALHVDMRACVIDHFASFVLTPLLANKVGSLNLHSFDSLLSQYTSDFVIKLFSQSRWPHLHSLYLHLERKRGLVQGARPVSDILNLTSATELVDFRIGYNFQLVIPLRIQSPLPCSLRFLHCSRHIDPSSIMDLLNACRSSLEVFVWNSCVSTGWKNVTIFTFPLLPKLHTLRLFGRQALRHMARIEMCTPNVTHLYFGQLHEMTPYHKELLQDVDFASLFPKLEYLNQHLPFVPFIRFLQGRRGLKKLEVRGGVVTNLEGLLLARAADGAFELESLETFHGCAPTLLNLLPRMDLAQIERIMKSRGAMADTSHGFCLILAELGRIDVDHAYLDKIMHRHQGRFRIEFKEHPVPLGELD